MDRRDFLKSVAACSFGLCGCAAGGRTAAVKSFSLNAEGVLRIPVNGIADTVRLSVVGDTHLSLIDERDEAYAGNCSRMAAFGGDKEVFAKTVARAKARNADLLCLVGDILSFPTFANVGYAEKKLREGGVGHIYVAGNHDWHFEGVSGSDESRRAKWMKRLAPLYGGMNPLYTSKVVKGVRFVTIDNSVYHVDDEQLEFWKGEASKGDPVVLLMHIPLWTEGWGIFTCGCPDWGSAVDPYWEIERREKWAARQSPSTFAFRESVLATPNLVAVFSGHLHRLMASMRPENQLMFSVPSNRTGECLDVELVRPGA